MTLIISQKQREVVSVDSVFDLFSEEEKRFLGMKRQRLSKCILLRLYNV